MTRAALILLLLPSLSFAFASPPEIAKLQHETAAGPLGQRIAFWAEQFVGSPYDPDPLGEYVSRDTIVSDERVDCMYLVFRSVELALGKDPEDSVRIALDKRFLGTGKMQNGKVLNYEDRFRYGEDMIDSGKWGREITSQFGTIASMKGTRGRKRMFFVKTQAVKNTSGLMSGDVVFFIKSPEKILSDELVGHMGIIKKEGEKVFLIHAAGLKHKGGRVKKVLFSDYLKSMPFAGIRVSRFEDERDYRRD